MSMTFLPLPFFPKPLVVRFGARTFPGGVSNEKSDSCRRGDRRCGFACCSTSTEDRKHRTVQGVEDGEGRRRRRLGLHLRRFGGTSFVHSAARVACARGDRYTTGGRGRSYAIVRLQP